MTFNQVGLRLDLDFAKREAQEAYKSLLQLDKQYRALADAQGENSIDAVRLRTALVRQKGEVSKLETEWQAATNALELYNAEAREAQRQRFDANTNFDAVSRNVALAGDVQSNLGALSALTSSGEIAIAGELFALAEELPRLKAALQGIPGVISSAVTALGPVGIGLGAAVIGAGVIFSQVAGQIEEGNRRLERGIETILGFRRAVADGSLSTEDARQRLEELRREQEIYAADLALLEGEYQRQREEIGIYADLFGGELKESLATSREALEEVDREIRLLTDALDENALAANDAAEAEERRAEVRERQLRQGQADRDAQVENRRQVLLRLKDLTQEEARERIEALEAEREITREVIKDSRLSTEATNRYAAQLRNLTSEIGILEGALDSLPTGEGGFTEQQENLISTTRDFNADIERLNEQRLMKLSELENKYADAQIAAAEKAEEAASKLLRDLQDELASLSRDLSTDLADAATEARRSALDAQINEQRQQRDALRDHLRTLRDIRQRDQEQERRLLAQGRAAEVFSLRRRRAEDIQAASRNFTDRQADIRQDLADTTQDLQRELQQQRADLLAKYEADRELALQQYQQERALQAQQFAEEQRRREQAYQQQRRELVQASNEQLRLRQQQYNAEIAQLVGFGQARIQTEAQIQQALLAQAQATAAAIAGLSAAGALGFGGQTTNNTLNINGAPSGAMSGRQVERIVQQQIANTFIARR